ncbi:hypothetical protein [Aquimarina agarivorans]|uniref:hypothetical protein n=1 Tax=Aquimarina agarivorans TaxID=980584 RepID=UPI001EE6513F|nr:hypothetical protein [Aquimarina agarivorans]
MCKITAQESPEKKTYTIDFSGLNNKPKPEEPSQPELPEDAQLLSIDFLRQPANLSQNAISAFNIKSIIDTENFGKEKNDDLQFGKPSDTKTYLDVVYEPLALKTDSVDFFYGDIDLGSFTTKAKYLYIILRDSQAIDRDEVKVVKNDKTIFSRIMLTGTFVDYRVALDEGINKIEIEAISSGLSEPVTCHIVIVDELDQKMLDQNFDVAVGFKAKLVVIRE